MDVFLWLVFTSNLISQTTWLKVKLKLVNLNKKHHSKLCSFLRIKTEFLERLLAEGAVDGSTHFCRRIGRRYQLCNIVQSMVPATHLALPWACFWSLAQARPIFYKHNMLTNFTLRGSSQLPGQVPHRGPSLAG